MLKKILLPLVILINYTIIVAAPQSSYPAHWKIYNNKKFGISFAYPKNLVLSNKFKTSKYLTDRWSVAETVDFKPKDLSGQHKIAEITLIDFNTMQDLNKRQQLSYFEKQMVDSAKKYQLGGFYYLATVRVGASANSNDVKNCYSTAYYGGNSTGTVSKKMINGRLFYALDLSEAGMDQSFSGVSYRSKVNGYCYSIEYTESQGNLNPVLMNNPKISNYYHSLAEKIIHTVHIQN